MSFIEEMFVSQIFVFARQPRCSSFSLHFEKLGDGVGDTPVLYHDYYQKVCPPKYTMNSNGDCDHLDPNENCKAFCQVRTNFRYGLEAPWGAYCEGAGDCTLTETHTQTITWTWTAHLDVIAALNLGISGGYSDAEADARALAHTKKLVDGQCGYFTWVPIVKQAWSVHRPSLSNQMEMLMMI